MKNPNFPEKLYVHLPLNDKDPFDGYTIYEDAEEDDIIAIYELKKVCRLAIKKEIYLEEMIEY